MAVMPHDDRSDLRDATRRRVTESEVPGWAGGVMAALRWATLVVEVAVMVLLGTLAGGVLLGLGPALHAGSVVTARMAAEPTPWRTFWRTWRADFARSNLQFAPAWVVGVLLWFDGVALRVLAGPAAALATGGLVLVAAWCAVATAYWPRVVARYDRGPLETWRFLLLAPLLGPTTSLATLVVGGALLLAAYLLPLAAVLVGPAFWLWATGRLVDDRLDRIDARPT